MFRVIGHVHDDGYRLVAGLRFGSDHDDAGQCRIHHCQRVIADGFAIPLQGFAVIQHAHNDVVGLRADVLLRQSHFGCNG
ncbi:hypothetical protein D3C76_1521260 [compost metagenome]